MLQEDTPHLSFKDSYQRGQFSRHDHDDLRFKKDYSHKQNSHKDTLYFAQYRKFTILNDYRLRKTVT